MDQHPPGMAGQGLTQDVNPQTEHEAFVTALRGGKDAEYEELNDYISTGNNDSEELAFLRECHSLYSQYRFICQRLGVQTTQSDISGFIDSKIQFFTESGKSKGGFGLQMMKTERVHQSQNYWETQTFEELKDEGIMESLKNSVGKAVGNNTKANGIDGYLPKRKNVF